MLDHYLVITCQFTWSGHINFIDLCYSGYSGKNVEYAALRSFPYQFRLVRQAGPGANQAHFANEHIEKLGQLIQLGFT